MPGPFTEDRVFRATVVVAAAAVSIAIVAAVAGSSVAAWWALALVIAAMWFGFRAWQRTRTVERHRVLIVADAPLDPPSVLRAMGKRWAAEPTEVMILVPSQHAGCAAKVERERQGMEISLQAVREAGAKAQGRVVEARREEAVAQAKERFEPDEVMFATPGELSPLLAV